MKRTKRFFYTTALIVLLSGCMSHANKKTIIKKINFEYGTPHTTFSINGNPVYVMIDTGSTFGFHLQESQLNNIKGLIYKRTYRSTDGAGKYQENIEYTVKSLNVDGVMINNITVTPFKKWGLMISGTGDLPESSVAGLGLFENKQIILDYKNNTFIMTDHILHDDLIKKGYKEYVYEISSDGILIEVSQSGNKYHLILDTGASVSMIWKERLHSLNLTSCLTVNPEMDNEGCEATVLEITQKNGGSTYFGAVVVPGDFKHMDKVDGLIGNNLLADKEIFFDLKNKKLYIK